MFRCVLEKSYDFGIKVFYMEGYEGGKYELYEDSNVNGNAHIASGIGQEARWEESPA